MSTKQLGFSKRSTEGTTVGEGGAVVVVLLDVGVEVLVVIGGGGGGFVEVVVARNSPLFSKLLGGRGIIRWPR
jgi:hypothetical protein